MHDNDNDNMLIAGNAKIFLHGPVTLKILHALEILNRKKTVANYPA